jgi:hypothetical protein
LQLPNYAQVRRCLHHGDLSRNTDDDLRIAIKQVLLDQVSTMC